MLGHDVVAEPLAVRRRIGLAGQFAAVDAELTGRENVEMIARLYHLARAEARRRAADVLERFALQDAADRRVSTRAPARSSGRWSTSCARRGPPSS